MVHSVLKGGVRKMFFLRENQRFVLVNWVKLLNVQPWGPRLSDGEQNYGQKTAIFGHIQFNPFEPIKNNPWGLRGPPKTAIFGHTWQYLAIDGPS